MTASDGRKAAMAAAQSYHSPDRVPARSPAPPPALAMSVHGNPVHMMSTAGTVAQSAAVMSPRFGTCG